MSGDVSGDVCVGVGGRLLLCLALGCGAGTTTTVPRTVVSDSTSVVAGLPVVRMTRPTAGLVRATLTLDVGSRDADPPALATLAAWIAAEGTGARGLVRPDTTDFVAECETEEIGACLTSLRAALSRREVDLEVHAAQVAALRSRRRSALADPARRAVTLAVSAAFDDAGVDPLHHDPTRAIASEDVAAFWTQHYGRSRGLLTLEGELPTSLSLDAFVASLPTAEASRGSREANAVTLETRVEGGSGDATAVALRFADPERAMAIARALVGSDHGARLFRLRGGAVVVVSVPQDELARTVQLARTVVTTSAWMPTPLEAWLDSEEDSADGIGVGATIRDDQAHDFEAQGERIVADARRGYDAADVGWEGRVDAADADVVLANGAHILVHRQPGEVGVVIAFAGGAALDPTAEHGRSAVAARALASMCPGTGPFVRADAFGLTARIAIEDIALERVALRRVVECATAAPDGSAWSRAQAHARASLSATPERAWAASALAPGAPGWVAPEGSTEGASAARRGGWLTRARTGARVRIAVVGDVEVEDAVRQLAGALALLPAGEATPGLDPGEAHHGIVPEDREGMHHRVVVGWRGNGGVGADLAATAFARAVAGQLGRRGLDVRWHDGGGTEEVSWAAVVVDVDDATLDTLPASVASACGAEVDVQSAHRSARWALRDPVAAATRLAVSASLAVPAPDMATVRSLQQSRPTFVIGREQPADALRRERRARR